MTDAPPFAGSHLTLVALPADDLVVALPLAAVTSLVTLWLSEFDGCPMAVEVPTLLYAMDAETWSVEMGLLRVDRVETAVPWVAKRVDAEGVGLALGDAMRARPSVFAVTPDAAR